MKKVKSTIALVCAILCVLSPVGLIACRPSTNNADIGSSEVVDSLPSQDSSATPPADEDFENHESVESSDSLENSVNSRPQLSTPPPSSESSKNDESAGISNTVQYIRCTADSVNIRLGAGTGYTVLGSAKKNTMYAIVGKTGNWYKTYYRGQTAYLSADYFSVVTLEASENDSVEDVLAEGYKLIGVPYVYGAVRVHDGSGRLLSGFSAQKFDCSSLVQYVFYKGAGVILQSHTRAQVKQGKFVKKSELQRGDCIFFTNEERKNNVGIERVGHVAIYLGDDYILHTASDYARIEKMTAYRWNFYIEARRFL